MNRRNKEFVEEVRELLWTILEELDHGYEKEVDLDYIINKHMRDRMIATKDCAMRHFDNLSARGLFLITKYSGWSSVRTKVKLNPKMADKEIDLLIGIVKMPSLPKAQTQTTPQP